MCVYLCWQHEIDEFANSSFVPVEQSCFFTPNLAGAVAIADSGVERDNSETTKSLREIVSRYKSLKCE